uniref:Uncharacterized protein n=1 Tax=Glossina austeni TaxID=7395 RepID=A0A1A9V4D8_GLOAU
MLTNSVLKKKREDCKKPKLILEARHSLSIEMQKMKKERLRTRLFIPENKASASASALASPSAEKRRYIGKLENILRRTKAKVSTKAPNLKGQEEKRKQFASNERTTPTETQSFRIKKNNKSGLQTHQVKLQELTRMPDIDSDDNRNKSKTNYALRDYSPPIPHSSFEIEASGLYRASLESHTDSSTMKTEVMTEHMTPQISSYKFYNPQNSDIAKNDNHSDNIINSTNEHSKHIARFYRDDNARQDEDRKSIVEHQINLINANRQSDLLRTTHNHNSQSHDNRNGAIIMKTYQNNDSTYLLHNPYNLKHASLSQSNGNYLPAISREMNVNNSSTINNNFPVEGKLRNFENMNRRRTDSLKRENRVKFPQFYTNSQLYCDPRNSNIMKIENGDANDDKLETQYNSLWHHNILIGREQLEEALAIRDQRNWENEMQISRRIASQLPYSPRTFTRTNSITKIDSNDIHNHYFFDNKIENNPDRCNMVCTLDSNINAYRTNFQMYGSANGIQNFCYNNARPSNETSQLIPYVEHDIERQTYIQQQRQYLPMMHLLSNEIMRTAATPDIFPRYRLGQNEHSINTQLFLPPFGQTLPHTLTSDDFTAPGANHVFSPL